MADIALTAAQVAPVFPAEAEIYDFVTAEAVTKGQVVYLTSAGTVGLADGNAGGKTQPVGIALKAAAAGQATSVLKKGHCAGFTLGNPGTKVFLSDTAGAIADAAATIARSLGQVVVLSDKPNYTKCVYFEFDWSLIYA